jgi:hypothetical protein
MNPDEVRRNEVTALKRKRPFGVTIVCVLQVVSALLLASWLVYELEKRTTIHVWRLAVAGGALVLVGLVIAVGLWRLKRWAWIAVMFWTGATLAVDLVDYIHGNPDYLTMLASIFVVFYLNQADVQAAYRGRRAIANAAHD